MIYVTGDTHCPKDMHKLNTSNFPEQRQMTKNDTLIICGDFGAVWKRDSGEDRFWLNWLDDKNCTICFCDGNHENFDLLYEFPVVEWNGGKVHQIRESVFHLMRGEIYTIEGKTFFVLGGAESTDKEWRTEGISWWAQEVPSKEELDHARATLDSIDWKVDYIVTHTCPSSCLNVLGFRANDDTFQNFLNELDICGEYKHWYFGHFHQDVQLDEKHTCLYNKVAKIEDDNRLSLDSLVMELKCQNDS